MKIFTLNIIYKVLNRIFNILHNFIDIIYVKILFRCNNIEYVSFQTCGVPYISKARNSKCSIGQNFSMNNHISGNPIGCFNKCTFFIDTNSELIIGNNVGISQTALVSTCKIEIQDNVKIGGGVSIYTTDFHSLNPKIRKSKEDVKFRNNSPILIKENAFIGAHSIILKGVTIGKNSIIGAGSIVTKSVPDNQIWAGNPAKFIKDIKI